ncbi:uncharacterized protein [Malus domestica]|uniref:uncharacterized protein isoform X1 n=1 Tax=Malus domestica TaxID=3750 RepID=UPI0039766AE3
MKKQLLKIVKSQPVSHFSLVTLFDGFALPFVFHVLIIEGLSVERVSPFFLSFSSLSFPTFSYAFSVSFFRVLANGNGVHFSQVLCCHFHAGSTSGYGNRRFQELFKHTQLCTLCYSMKCSKSV